MASKTDICNTALARLGQEPITSFTDNTDSAKRCDVLFDEVSDLVMASGEWTTLRARQELARIPTNPVHGYDFQYQLPTDLLKLIEIDVNTMKSERYQREGDKILTDAGSVRITYIKRETNVQLWGPHLITAVSLKLAAELALSFTGSASIVQGLEQKYARWMRKALSQDSQQSSGQIISSDDLLIVR